MLSASDPAGSLQFFEHRAGMLHTYRFGHKTADFLTCRNCGTYIGARMESSGRRFGIVNVRVLQPPAARWQEPAPTDYGNESASERQARRERRWTPLR
ncbi:MAG TPA: hypothetical protein VFO94_10385 [Gammaproteobacteria bacterium]|nr:hypothetical protein [Gammaproteobacteria bacterium]